MPLFRKKPAPDPARVPRRRLADPSEPPMHDTSRQYRRGMTIAGSTQHRLQKNEERALKTATPREKIHHLLAIRRRLTVVLWLLMTVTVLLAAAVSQFTARVHIDYTTDNARLPAANQYSRTIQRYLADHPLERLRPYTNQAALQAYVIAHHPEVAQLNQTGAAGLGESAYSIALRRPVASWKVKNTTYYVDAHGVSFRYNAFANPRVAVVDNSGASYQAGSAVASSRFLGFVGRIVSLAQARSITITEATIPPRSFRQVECTIAGKPYKVLMSIDRSAGEQVEDAQRAMQYFESQKRTPQYIDVRVKGKAFFRE